MIADFQVRVRWFTSINLSNPSSNPTLFCYCVVVIIILIIPLYIQENQSSEKLNNLPKKVIELGFDSRFVALIHAQREALKTSLVHHTALAFMLYHIQITQAGDSIMVAKCFSRVSFSGTHSPKDHSCVSLRGNIEM